MGSPGQSIVDLGSSQISILHENDLNLLKNSPGLNSMRFFRSYPASGDFTSGVICLNYPKKTPIMDIMDLLPRVKKWVNTTPQNLGNWTSKEAVLQELAVLETEPVPVFREELPLKLLNEVLQDNGELTVIGFDVLQIPRYKVTLRLK